MVKAFVSMSSATLPDMRFGIGVTVYFYQRNSGVWTYINGEVLEVDFPNVSSRSRMESAIRDAVLGLPATKPGIYDPAVWDSFSENDIVSYVSISVG